MYGRRSEFWDHMSALFFWLTILWLFAYGFDEIMGALTR